MNGFDIAQGIILSNLAERNRKHDLEALKNRTEASGWLAARYTESLQERLAECPPGHTNTNIETLKSKIETETRNIERAHDKYNKAHDKHGYRIDDMKYIFKEDVPPVDL